jgi:hypothetical protein
MKKWMQIQLNLKHANLNNIMHKRISRLLINMIHNDSRLEDMWFIVNMQFI